MLILIGVIGTFLPGIPGAPIVFAGMWLAAWADDFRRIGWVTLVILGLLTLLTLVADLLGAFLGAKRVGASRLALAGAAIGSVVGLFFGLPGALVGPFLGAAAGELIAQRQFLRAARVGIGTWIGLVLSTLARVALVFAMLAVFIVSYLI